MTLKNTIKRMLTTYPTLFQDRAQCLDHLFCVIGNGYDWKNGQLVSRDYEDTIERSFDTDSLMKESLDLMIDSSPIKGMDVSLSTFTQYQLVELYRRERAKANLDKIIEPNFHKFINVNYEFYPLCNYSKILNLPKDIKPDWLDGARETLHLLKQHNTHGRSKTEQAKWIKVLDKDKRLR